MADDTQTPEQTLDPLTVLASKQADLESRIAQMSEALTVQNQQMAELMKSNAALLAQNNALIQNASKPEPQKQEAVQDLAFREMMKNLGLKE